MPAARVNLDALIPREDFEATADEQQPNSLTTTMKISDLGTDNFAYSVLRKPDFQRETASWTPKKVADLVQNFLNGDLIPSVILWRSPASGSIFVIDGAHRLSALIAWAQDDYGDSHNSLRFFGNVIPDDQLKAAKETRSLIAQSVGSYAQLTSALRNPDTADKNRLRLARNLGAFAISLQWVIGEAVKAEESFFRINQQAAPILDSELDIIRARRKPNALATRAFIRAGTGHKYWSSFSEENQAEVERIAKEVYDLLFRPTVESSVKSVDLPVAGRGYSADSVQMMFQLVNFVNKVQPEMWKEPPSLPPSRVAQQAAVLEDDTTGEATLNFMRSVRSIASRISGNSPGSLGLDPAVYFYSATGRFQPAAFLATVEFITSLIEKRQLNEFTRLRSRFEDFFVKHKHFLNQITQRFGSVDRSVPHVVFMFGSVYDGLKTGMEEEFIIAKLRSHSALKNTLREVTDEDRQYGRNFTRETKSSIYLKSALANSQRCGICAARLDLKSATVDHKVRKVDGGTGAPSNAQLAHPYCNSGFKESLA